MIPNPKVVSERQLGTSQLYPSDSWLTVKDLDMLEMVIQADYYELQVVNICALLLFNSRAEYGDVLLPFFISGLGLWPMPDQFACVYVP